MFGWLRRFGKSFKKGSFQTSHVPQPQSQPQPQPQPVDGVDNVDIKAFVTYYVDAEGDFFIDLGFVDVEDKTISDFASLLAQIPSIGLTQDLFAKLREGLLEAGEEEAFMRLLRKYYETAVSKAGLVDEGLPTTSDEDSDEDGLNDEEPIISPLKR